MKLIAISGSLRAKSSNAALLRAVQRVAPDGVEIEIYEGLGELPHFNPDLDGEDQQPPASVAALRALLRGADGVVLSSPEYAHGVPGSLKNMLDWLVSAGELARKPVVLFNASPQGGMYAQNALVETLRTMDWNVVEEASLLEPFLTKRIAGELDDEKALQRLRAALHALLLAV
jgi:chromate reductase